MVSAKLSILLVIVIGLIGCVSKQSTRKNQFRCRGCCSGPTHYEIKTSVIATPLNYSPKYSLLSDSNYRVIRSFYALSHIQNELLRANIAGWIELELNLSTDGTINSISVINSSNPGFKELIEANSKNWIYVILSKNSMIRVKKLDRCYSDILRLTFDPVLIPKKDQQ